MRVLRTVFFFTLLFSLLILFISHSSLAVLGARYGLSLFFETVFPALFPFLVLSELILFTGAGYALGRLFSRPLRAFFGVSQAGSASLILGVLCGQPVASSVAVSLYEQGGISKKEVQRLSLFANNPGASFLIAAVGGALFGNITAGIALFCITQLSAAVVGITLRIFCGKTAEIEKKCPDGMNYPPFSALFTSSVQHAFSCVLQVGAFLIFFSALLNILTDLLSNLSFDTSVRLWILGCLEITAGIKGASGAIEAYSAFRLACFLCGFGGLCVCMQILSVTQKCELPAWKYLLSKLFQGGIALLLCEGYLRLFHPVLAPNKTLPTFAPTAHLPVLSGMLFLLFLTILLQKKSSLFKN